MSETSTKPYLLRAIYEWCTDNGFTPYIASKVDAHTRVPREFVKNGEIVLNISFSATSGLKMDNDCIHFSARFGGVSRDILVPVENVVAIYARENGQGMAFEVTQPVVSEESESGKSSRSEATIASPPALTSVPTSVGDHADEVSSDNSDDDPPKSGGRPRLTRIK